MYIYVYICVYIYLYIYTHIYIYIYISIYVKCKILTFVKQCLIHRSRAMYILWEEKENAPGNKVLDVVVFEGPDVLAEFSGVSVLCGGMMWCGFTLAVQQLK